MGIQLIWLTLFHLLKMGVESRTEYLSIKKGL